MKRRTFLCTMALAAGTAGAQGRWWQPDWFPERGLRNPCFDPKLPQSLADHPAIADALRGLDGTRLWDCHVHLVGTGDRMETGVWVNPMLSSFWHPYKALQKRFYMNASCVDDEKGANELYIERLLSLLDAIPALHLMLLAFDFNYDEAGRRRPDRSTFHISNAYAQAVTTRHPRLEWICSVHPYREDAVEALEWSAANGARAVKWLPPAMGMDPSSPLCDPFYEAMQRLNLPLLSHGGHEMAAKGGGHEEYGNPLLLRRALDQGVRVIVAHCASLGNGFDLRGPGKGQPRMRNFNLFMEMMRDPAYEKLLYGDISAITQQNRAPEALQALLLADDLHHRLLNGSDYPLSGILPLFSLNQFKRLGIIEEQAARAVFEVQKYNPLLFDLALKRNLVWQGRRFSNRVFETADFFQDNGERG